MGWGETAAITSLEQSLSLGRPSLEGARHSPEQLAVGGPAWAGGLDKMTPEVPSNLNPSVNQRFSTFLLFLLFPPKVSSCWLVSFMYIHCSPFCRLFCEGRIWRKRVTDVVTKLSAASFTRWKSASYKPLSIVHSGGRNYAESMQHSVDSGCYTENPTAIRVNSASD